MTEVVDQLVQLRLLFEEYDAHGIINLVVSEGVPAIHWQLRYASSTRFPKVLCRIAVFRAERGERQVHKVSRSRRPDSKRPSNFVIISVG
jgi:hypothetical protein